jgi:hypothetical protein
LSDAHEREVKRRFSDRSTPAPKLTAINVKTHVERRMSEFIRSSLIILMGMTVMAAGVLVVFYG